MNSEPAVKRAKLDVQGQDEQANPTGDCDAAPPPPPGSPPAPVGTEEDAPPPPPPGSPPRPGSPAQDDSGIDVEAALQRITGHIGTSKKLGKAVALVQKLLASGACRRRHGGLLLQVVDAALTRPEDILEPTIRREYRRLFRALDDHLQLLNEPQRRHLDIYRLLAISRGALLGTDDSFIFNKLVSEMKALVQKLPDLIEDAPDALPDLKARMEALRSNGYERPAGPDRCDDGSGLVLEGCKDHMPGLDAWTSEEADLMSADALLTCLKTMKDACYGNAWARTSIDMALMEVSGKRQKFSKSQHPMLVEFKTFVTEQRARRKQGPSAAEKRRDTTDFEKARASWSTSNVSHRGKVGAGGDHKSEQWLG